MRRMHRNESPYPPSPQVIKSVREWISKINNYSDPSLWRELANALEKYTGFPHSMLVYAPGSLALIRNAIIIALKNCGRLITYRPTFEAVLPFAKSYGVTSCTVNLRSEDFELDISQLLNFKPNRNDIIYISNPNNPTGNIIIKSKSELEELLSTEALVVLDEAYYEFSGVTYADLTKDWSNLIILRTLSKAFCLAGARLGYAIASEELVNKFRSLISPFDIPLLTYIAAIEALNDIDYMRNVIRKIINEREKMYNELLGLEGVKPYRSYTNFILISLEVLGIEAYVAHEYFKNQGILITIYPQENMLEYCIRVSISNAEDNEYFLHHLKKLIARGKERKT